MRGFRQIPRVEAVRTCLQRSSSNAQSVSTDAKHNSTASSKKRTSHFKPSVTLRAQSEVDFTLKRLCPKPSSKRAYLDDLGVASALAL